MNRVRIINDLVNVKKHLLDEKEKKDDYHIECSIIIIEDLLEDLEEEK